jgi:hypothetical protein
VASALLVIAAVVIISPVARSFIKLFWLQLRVMLGA